ncbi:hypothetical protein KXQ82_17505 [Mucilaginibacter sp. HMF5004]|uniref:MG2 domain-containing protein n=1 Tax=Mucilaginibacter rivuli TaxID=2857527 RepID=UPI001C5F0CE7|nr:MG2 domain-containing protein [Mucilaginibacter rivuli]MBW4891528.1 hypothetical protein [Mucilaginibacter rivuli]
MILKYMNRLSLTALLLFVSYTGFSQAQKAPAGKLFFEKVYLHTDRDYYSTGDDMWFKAYLVDAQTNIPLGYTNNLYVDLVDPNAKIINTETVFMANGLGKGDFKLADSIPAGTYRLRAYTNWMRNFGDNFIFEKTITISNTIIDKQGAAGAAAKTLAKQNKPAVIATTKGKSIIRFFPEGGSMVNDVTGIVAFKAEDPNGKDVSVKASIISSTGDTVARFNSTAQGTGLFVFTPEANKTYAVKGAFNNNQPFTTTLPAALAKGYTIHTSDADPEHLRIIISTNQATLADNPDKEIVLTARHTGLRVLNATAKFQEMQISATLPKKQFPAGVSSITIYDKQQHPQCERLIFIPDSISAKALTVKTDKIVYASKEKVTLNIKAADARNNPLKANLSVAVVDAKVVPAGDGNIVSYLMLQSEVRGKIEHPERYFDTTNTNRFKQIDLLLMTQGWRDFVWKRLADTAIRISYPAEDGFAVSGRLRAKFANKPIPNTNVTLTIKGPVVGQAYLTKTDSAGKYYFKGVPFTGGKDITLAAFDDKQKKVGLIQMDSLNKAAIPANPVRQFTVDTVSQVAFLNADAVRSRGKQRLSDTLKLKELTIKANKYDQLFNQTVTKFGYPDLTYPVTSKYYFYNSLRDFLIHEVPGARVNDVDTVYFLGAQFDVEKNRDSQKKIVPRFIANGREDVDDISNGIYLDLTMDVINKVTVRHVLGQTVSAASSTGTYGTGAGGDVYLIFLDLKPNAMEKAQLSMVNAHVDGYYEARTFYKPVYNAGNQGKPDSRTAIFWEPDVITDASGTATLTFFNADPKTNIRVVVQGLTEKGTPVVSGTTYMVK